MQDNQVDSGEPISIDQFADLVTPLYQALKVQVTVNNDLFIHGFKHIISKILSTLPNHPNINTIEKLIDEATTRIDGKMINKKFEIGAIISVFRYIAPLLWIAINAPISKITNYQVDTMRLDMKLKASNGKVMEILNELES